MEMSSSEFQEKLCLMLRSLRIHAGLKQSDLVDRLGMSNSQYIYYEVGKVCPDLFTLRRIADILEIDVSSFLYPERFAEPASDSRAESR